MQYFPDMPHPAPAPTLAAVPQDLLRALLLCMALPAALSAALSAALAALLLALWAGGRARPGRTPARDWYPGGTLPQTVDSPEHRAALRAARRLRAWIGWILRFHPDLGMAPSGARAVAPAPTRIARAPPPAPA